MKDTPVLYHTLLQVLRQHENWLDELHNRAGMDDGWTDHDGWAFVAPSSTSWQPDPEPAYASFRQLYYSVPAK